MNPLLQRLSRPLPTHHASDTASATITTPLSPPAVPTDSSSSKVQRSRILAADPELDTVRKFNQGAAYTPFHPCLQEVQGSTAHEYTPMFIPGFGLGFNPNPNPNSYRENRVLSRKSSTCVVFQSIGFKNDTFTRFSR